MLQALVKLARNQILLEAQLHTHTEQLADHDQRLEDIGRHRPPGHSGPGQPDQPGGQGYGPGPGQEERPE